jgi:hypothetical protein
VKYLKRVLLVLTVLALVAWLFGDQLLKVFSPWISGYMKTFPPSEYRDAEVEGAYPQRSCQSSHTDWGSRVRATQSLDGEWDVAQGDLSDTAPGEWKHRVPVPGFVSEAKPAFNEVGVSSDEREAFWYRTQFTAPDTASELAVLCLHKAKYGARVWLNGQDLGMHHGAYTLSEYDLSKVIRYGESNELIVRLGAYFDAVPDFVPIGQDSEKYAWYPGLWDSVSVVYTGAGSIVRTKVEPDIDKGVVLMRTTVRNNGTEAARFTVTQRIREWKSQAWVSATEEATVHLGADETKTLVQEVSVDDFRLWSPEDPFLYVVQSSLLKNGEASDDRATRFGMRKAEWKGGEEKGFYLNNKLYYLRGTNIALHRFFDDKDRGQLAWDEDWIRELYSGHMKDFQWNSFRFHLGRAPNLWYDIADEVGFIVTDEYHIFSPIRIPFSHTEDPAPQSINWSLAELKKEYVGWVQEAWNHASIGWWDASNENHNPLPYEAVPLVRGIDETRQWDSGSYRAADRPDDPLEEHPYKFNGTSFFNSNDRNYTLADLDGFTRQPPQTNGDVFATWDGEGARNHPYINNEYGWLWITRDGSDGTSLSDKAFNVLAPGVDLTPDERRELYAYVNAELTGYWRAGRGYAGIQHFLHLGKCSDKDDIAAGLDPNKGPSFTCDNFIDVPALTMEPRWERWAPQAFAPVAINIDLWSPQAYKAGPREIPLTLLNDTYVDHTVAVKLIVAAADGSVLSQTEAKTLSLPALARVNTTLEVTLPAQEKFVVYALMEGGFKQQAVVSRRKVGFAHPGIEATLPREVAAAVNANR